MFADQTDVPESGDWWDAAYLVLWGSNVPMTRTPDDHWMTEAAARAELDALADSDFGRDNPGVIRRWRDSWELVIPFFDFAPEVRKVIYTTNMIESINATLRRSTRNRGHFPSDEALLKVLYLACKEMGRTSTRSTAGRGSGVPWRTALNQFDIMFPGRLDQA
ncbi:transposase [Geodermatophilus maliterrae]|uniref:Mutator family transposase n=1 Tax=Geodermatophilus maliterrae TaxID=3162531 RepID=A0ABV3XDH4_9ACTN